VRIFDLNSEECVTLMEGYIRDHPEIWYEDIGEDAGPSG
jgi:cytosine deaminase